MTYNFNRHINNGFALREGNLKNLEKALNRPSLDYPKTTTPPATDLNLIISPGKYELLEATDYTNAPKRLLDNTLLIVETNPDSNVIYQWALMTDGTMVFRSNKSTWTNWAETAKDANVVHKDGTEVVPGDKTFTGVETFAQPIVGNLEVKKILSAPVDLFTLENGSYYIGSDKVSNSPVPSSTSFTVDLFQTDTAGHMLLTNFDGRMFWVQKTGSAWKTWKEFADNSNVVHTSGPETIGGPKAFDDPIVGSITGSATKLATARKINGIGFDGTSDININSSTAEVANKLKTARLIGGVLFDGTKDIDLPGVNIKGNQDTSGHASSADTANSATNAGHATTADSAQKLSVPRKINGTDFDGTSDINVNAANDSNLVHLTGAETIVDDKTFTGNTGFSGGLKGGQINLPASGDLNALTDTGKYYQTVSVNTQNWTNRPSNAPTIAFSVDVIGQANRSLVTQLYYVHTTSRMWVRTMWLDGSNIATSQWAELANDSNVVHKTGAETVAGDKTFTGTTTINNVVSSNVKNASITFNGLTVSFMERAAGVDTSIIGNVDNRISPAPVADDTWHILGNIPANITPPKINMYTSYTGWSSTASGSTTRANFRMIISFNTTGEIDYRLTSLRENDSTATYTPLFLMFSSINWNK